MSQLILPGTITFNDDGTHMTYVQAQKIVDNMGQSPTGAFISDDILKKVNCPNQLIDIVDGEITLQQLKALVMVIEHTLFIKNGRTGEEVYSNESKAQPYSPADNVLTVRELKAAVAEWPEVTPSMDQEPARVFINNGNGTSSMVTQIQVVNSCDIMFSTNKKG